MTRLSERHWALILIALSLTIIAGAWFSAEGPFLIDEVIYLMSADAFYRSGSLIVQNGLNEIGSDYMGLNFLVSGPNGLAPQYPIGMAIAGGAAYGAFGIKGLFLMNAIAAALTLFTVRDLAWRLFGDARVALAAPIMLMFATFWLEYAYGIWPHSISVFCVVLSLTLAVRGLHVSVRSRQVILSALGSGMAIGAGFLFRTDTILILPAIAAVIILFAPRPFLAIFGGAAGLTPFAIAAAFANNFKFGTFNPLSYGKSSGGVALSSYTFLIAAVVIGCVGLVMVRCLRPNRSKLIAALAVVGAVATAVTAPEVGQLLHRLGTGIAALIIDMRNLKDTSPGLNRFDYGTVQIYTLTKKALGQSLPWIGILTALALTRWSSDRRLGYTLSLLALVSWTAPFLVQSWQGGTSSNMRYFLPILPVLATLSARLLFDISDKTSPRPRTLTYGGLTALVIYSFWFAYGPAGELGAQQIFTVWMLGITALAILVLRLSRDLPLVGTGTQFVLAASVALGAATAATDFLAAQSRRQTFQDISAALAVIQPPSLMFGYAPLFYFQVGREDAFIGTSFPEVIAPAIRKGYSAYVMDVQLPEILDMEPELASTGERIEHPGGAVIRMKLADSP